MAEIGDDLFEGFDEAAEEEATRPKLSEPAELIIKRILAMKTNLTREQVINLIEAERNKSQGLLTEEVAAHLVASNLGADEIEDFFEADEDAVEQEQPKGDSKGALHEGDLTDQNLEGESPGKEAPAPTEGEDWFGEPAEEQPTAEEPAEETAEANDFFEPAGEEAEIILDEADIITVTPSSIVAPAISPEDMKAQMKLFQRMKASLLDKDKDIATIGGEPYIKRSGWRKFALAFNLSDEIIKEERDAHGDDFTWRIWVRAWAPNGRSVVGIGACSSEEREFAHLQHDVYAVAHTRAKNRALSDLIGSGEVSWDELKGFDYQ